jgi:hypothetical protein
MKIRIDKKKLFSGVSITHEMIDLYREFRKQLSLDVANW